MVKSLLRCVKFLVGGAIVGYVFVILVHAFLKQGE